MSKCQAKIVLCVWMVLLLSIVIFIVQSQIPPSTERAELLPYDTQVMCRVTRATTLPDSTAACARVRYEGFYNSTANSSVRCAFVAYGGGTPERCSTLGEQFEIAVDNNFLVQCWRREDGRCIALPVPRPPPARNGSQPRSGTPSRTASASIDFGTPEANVRLVGMPPEEAWREPLRWVMPMGVAAVVVLHASVYVYTRCVLIPRHRRGFRDGLQPLMDGDDDRHLELPMGVGIGGAPDVLRAEAVRDDVMILRWLLRRDGTHFGRPLAAAERERLRAALDGADDDDGDAIHRLVLSLRQPVRVDPRAQSGAAWFSELMVAPTDFARRAASDLQRGVADGSVFATECAVCLVAPRSVAWFPCGHYGACPECVTAHFGERGAQTCVSCGLLTPLRDVTFLAAPPSLPITAAVAEPGSLEAILADMRPAAPPPPGAPIHIDMDDL